jgi:hypothetical protein
MQAMARAIIVALCASALSAPAFADSYPVSGRFGVGAAPSKEPIDCRSLRVIDFKGDQRTDSRGGVPAYRLMSVTPSAGGSKIVEQFHTGQIRARATSLLRQVDANQVEMNLQPGGLLKLQRCK